jgi:hypothetical protein
MFRVCISSQLLQVIAFEFSVFTQKIVTPLLIWEWLGHINWFQCLLNFIRWLLGFPYGLRCYRISVISWFHHSSSEFDQWMSFALFWLTFSSYPSCKSILSCTLSYIYTCITPKCGARSARAEGLSLVEGSVCMRQTTGPVMTRVELARQVVGSVIAEAPFAWGKRPVPWWPELNMQRQVVGSIIAEVSFAWGKRSVP